HGYIVTGNPGRAHSSVKSKGAVTAKDQFRRAICRCTIYVNSSWPYLSDIRRHRDEAALMEFKNTCFKLSNVPCALIRGRQAQKRVFTSKFVPTLPNASVNLIGTASIREINCATLKFILPTPSVGGAYLVADRVSEKTSWTLQCKILGE